MNIALYGTFLANGFVSFMTTLLDELQAMNANIWIYKDLDKLLNKQKISNEGTAFSKSEELPNDLDYMICIGGDGTILSSIPFIRDWQVPVIGINSGRLGFLANIGKEEITKALQAIVNKDFEIEEKSLLTINSDIAIDNFNEVNIALNEVTVQKADSNIIAVDTLINDQYLNTYWTDGLIVSTPTGSTAYSLSIGGPIIEPNTEAILIAPIASHNLTVRPLVVKDSSVIKLQARSRSGKFLLTTDNRSYTLENQCYSFTVKKSEHKLKMVKFPFNNYFDTLRSKLMWGADQRNW